MRGGLRFICFAVRWLRLQMERKPKETIIDIKSVISIRFSVNID
jgi:hypothetical protein